MGLLHCLWKGEVRVGVPVVWIKPFVVRRWQHEKTVLLHALANDVHQVKPAAVTFEAALSATADSNDLTAYSINLPSNARDDGVAFLDTLK